MSDSRVTIFPCQYEDHVCSNYLCQQTIGFEKWYIGNAHGSHATCEIFCEDCIRHLVDHLPAEFSPEIAGIENRLRAEITAEYDKVLTGAVKEMENTVRAQVTAEVLSQFAKSEKGKPAPVIVEEEVAEATHVLYRCLDCNEEFDSPQKLGSHRRKHQNEKGARK